MTTMHVPPASDPRWAAILQKKTSQDPAFLGARMLIVRSRMALLTGGGAGQLHKFTAELRELYVQSADCRSAQQDLVTFFS
jgi:hypothetical protein